jgi:hypothetical protein
VETAAQPQSRSLDAVVPLDDPDGSKLLDDALTAESIDPMAAAIAFARAGLRGQPLAAYYLGQLFETGNGVARDRALARAWYLEAQEDVRSARRRLEDLAPPEQGIGLAPPLPLLGGPVTGSGSEFVWTSGDGADPSLYLVEIAEASDKPPIRLGSTTLSALRHVDIGEARIWRVVAVKPEMGAYSLSDWHLMGATPDPTVQSATPILPDIDITGPSDGSTMLADTLGKNFPGATIRKTVGVTETVADSVVRYFYDADVDLANQIADLTGGTASVQKAIISADELPLPGQIRILQAGP